MACEPSSPVVPSIPSREAIASIVHREKAAAHPALAGWLGEDPLERDITDELKGRLASGALYVEAHGVGAVVTHEPYANRYKFAHLRVWFHNASFHSAEAVDAFAPSIAAAFPGLRPRAICIFLSSGEASVRATVEGHDFSVPYKRFLAAPLGEIRRRAVPPNEHLRVVRPHGFDFYPAYQSIYERFWQARPDLKSLVPIESPDDLEQFHGEGALCIVKVDGEFAGVVAASRALEHGLRGWCMRERVLARFCRGRGLGAAVLHAFARDLDAADDELLFGTIAPGNAPSMRSALRLGRMDVGGLYWLRLDDRSDPLLDARTFEEG